MLNDGQVTRERCESEQVSACVCGSGESYGPLRYTVVTEQDCHTDSEEEMVPTVPKKGSGATTPKGGGVTWEDASRWALA